MQAFSFFYVSLLRGVGEEGVQGLAEQRAYVQGPPDEAAAQAQGRGGCPSQAGSSLRTRERCGRRFPSQESASFL